MGTPKLSPSIAHVLTSESPLHAWTIHRLLGNKPRPVTDAQEKGRLLHALLLRGAELVEVIDADDYRTKAAKEARDAARAANRIPVLADKHAAALVAVERIREAIDRLGLLHLDTGHAEHRVEWSEGAADCSGVLDWVSDDAALIADLKTTEGSAHPDVCAAKLLKEGGVIQDTAYRRAIGSLHPEMLGRVRMVFLFAQTVEPYAVTAVECGGSMQEIGAARWSRAVDVWTHCLGKGREREHWPSYADGVVKVDAPAWAMREVEFE